MVAMLNCVSAAPAVDQTGPVTAPGAFDVAGRKILLVVHGVGAQVYECRFDSRGGTTWVFREPVATLLQGDQSVGRHYVGPAWELADGDTVEGKQSATAPGATSEDVALLTLDVVKHTGSGILKDATSVLRLNTRGGILKGACQTAGELRAEPYSADYTFLR